MLLHMRMWDQFWLVRVSRYQPQAGLWFQTFHILMGWIPEPVFVHKCFTHADHAQFHSARDVTVPANVLPDDECSETTIWIGTNPNQHYYMDRPTTIWIVNLFCWWNPRLSLHATFLDRGDDLRFQDWCPSHQPVIWCRCCTLYVYVI